jgi:hypothetical protein
MGKIIELTMLATLLLFSFAAWGGAQVTDTSAKFIKCPKGSDCNYKIKVSGGTYKVVSSNEFNLDNEVQTIYDDLDKQKASESKPFCVTGRIISISSKKIKGGSFFKISSLGPIDLKERKSSPQRSHEAPMGQCAF